MKDFNFRLQRVLDYRTMIEKWAKQSYMAARAARIAQEAAIADHIGLRNQRLHAQFKNLQDRLNLEAALASLDDQEIELKIELQALEADEAGALSEWQVKRQDREALEKLHARAFDEWQVERNRHEQNDLDEWTTMRRKA